MPQKLFYKTVEKEQKNETTASTSPKRVLRWIIVVGLALLIVLVVSLEGFSFLKKVSSNWKEIQFAYQKPALVKSIREDYETKQEKLDQSFLKREKSPDEKLVDEVVKRLQAQETSLK